MAVEHRGQDVGYIWFSILDGTTDVLDFHACVSDRYRGRWLTRSIMSDLHVVARLLGARVVIAWAPTDFLRRIWRRAGFSIHGSFATLEIENKNNGISPTQGPADHPAAGPDAGPAGSGTTPADAVRRARAYAAECCGDRT